MAPPETKNTREKDRLEAEPPAVQDLIKALIKEIKNKPEGLTKTDTVQIIKRTVS